MSSSSDRQAQTHSIPSAAASNCTPGVIDAEEASTSVVKVYVSEDQIEFRTPTSRDHRIPRSRSCPPAPRKPKPNKSMAHKRKLMFEDAAREEVDAFFERSNPKRRSFGEPGSDVRNTTNGNNNNNNE